MSYNNPINQSNQEIEKAKQGKLDDDMIDAMDDATAYMEIIKENIEYEHHMKYGDWSEKGLYSKRGGSNRNFQPDTAGEDEWYPEHRHQHSYGRDGSV